MDGQSFEQVVGQLRDGEVTLQKNVLKFFGIECRSLRNDSDYPQVGCLLLGYIRLIALDAKNSEEVCSCGEQVYALHALKLCGSLYDADCAASLKAQQFLFSLLDSLVHLFLSGMDHVSFVEDGQEDSKKSLREKGDELMLWQHKLGRLIQSILRFLLEIHDEFCDGSGRKFMLDCVMLIAVISHRILTRVPEQRTGFYSIPNPEAEKFLQRCLGEDLINYSVRDISRFLRVLTRMLQDTDTMSLRLLVVFQFLLQLLFRQLRTVQYVTTTVSYETFFKLFQGLTKLTNNLQKIQYIDQTNSANQKSFFSENAQNSNFFCRNQDVCQTSKNSEFSEVSAASTWLKSCRQYSNYQQNLNLNEDQNSDLNFAKTPVSVFPSTKKNSGKNSIDFKKFGDFKSVLVSVDEGSVMETEKSSKIAENNAPMNSKSFDSNLNKQQSSEKRGRSEIGEIHSVEKKIKRIKIESDSSTRAESCSRSHSNAQNSTSSAKSRSKITPVQIFHYNISKSDNLTSSNFKQNSEIQKNKGQNVAVKILQAEILVICGLVLNQLSQKVVASQSNEKEEEDSNQNPGIEQIFRQFFTKFEVLNILSQDKQFLRQLSDQSEFYSCLDNNPGRISQIYAICILQIITQNISSLNNSILNKKSFLEQNNMHAYAPFLFSNNHTSLSIQFRSVEKLIEQMAKLDQPRTQIINFRKQKDQNIFFVQIIQELIGLVDIEALLSFLLEYIIALQQIHEVQYDPEDEEFEQIICQYGWKKINSLIKKFSGLSGRLDVRMFRVQDGFSTHDQRFFRIQNAINLISDKIFEEKALQMSAFKFDDSDFEIAEIRFECDEVSQYLEGITSHLCSFHNLLVQMEQDEEWRKNWVADLRLFSILFLCCVQIQIQGGEKIDQFVLENILVSMSSGEILEELENLKSNDEFLSQFQYIAESFWAVYKVCDECLGDDTEYNSRVVLNQFYDFTKQQFQSYFDSKEDFENSNLNIFSPTNQMNEEIENQNQENSDVNLFLSSVHQIFLKEEDIKVDPMDLRSRFQEADTSTDSGSCSEADDGEENGDEVQTNNDESENISESSDDGNQSDQSDQKENEKLNKSEKQVGNAYIRAVNKFEGKGRKNMDKGEDLLDFIVCREDDKYYMDMFKYLAERSTSEIYKKQE